METEALLQMIFRLGITAVLTIEKAHGDRKAGADKKALAKDWLQGATAGALSVLPGDKATMAAEASTAADEAIEAGFDLAKSTGLLKKATAQAATAQVAKPAPEAFLGQAQTS